MQRTAVKEMTHGHITFLKVSNALKYWVDCCWWCWDKSRCKVAMRAYFQFSTFLAGWDDWMLPNFPVTEKACDRVILSFASMSVVWYMNSEVCQYVNKLQVLTTQCDRRCPLLLVWIWREKAKISVGPSHFYFHAQAVAHDIRQAFYLKCYLWKRFTSHCKS